MWTFREVLQCDDCIGVVKDVRSAYAPSSAPLLGSMVESVCEPVKTNGIRHGRRDKDGDGPYSREDEIAAWQNDECDLYCC